MKTKKILITGSSGTIGTRLSEKLLDLKYDIVGIDWKKNKWIRGIEKRTIHIDLRNIKLVFEKLPKNIDLIIHLAANARVYDLVKNPKLAKDNMITTFNILEYARVHNIKNIIFASSREVYGNTQKIKNKEEDVGIENCESPYSASKLSGEALIHSYHKCFGINYVIVRFSNVYGMYDESDRVIPLFIRKALENESLIVFDKEKVLDFTYIDDAVGGVIKIIQKFGKIKNNTFNIATGKSPKIFDLAKLIKEFLHSKSKIIIKNNRKGEVMKYVADITKIKKLLNYQPKTDIISGIKKSIEWYQGRINY
ncbi:MAG: NAD-dependent epimerase/dehydratase family protein [Minisyncoccia bacterium]